MADDIIPSNAFDQVPAEAVVPGFYGEISAAASRKSIKRVLIVGQRLSSGTIDAAVPQFISGDGSIAKTFWGRGSMLADMVMAYRAGDPTMELWGVALDDDGAGTAAELDVTFTGTATAAGTLSFYVGDVKITAGVAVDDAAADVASALSAAINAATDLPVTAAVDAAVVTVTFRHKGAVGNDLRLQVNVGGIDAGEATPAGITVSIPDDGFLADGATDPEQTAVLSAIAGEAFDFILIPYTGSTELDAWADEMDARFGPLQMEYGGVFTARRATVSNQITWLDGRNDKHISVTTVYDTPGPVWKTAARMLARAARSLANHPVRGLNDLALIGELPPPRTSRLTWQDRQSLLIYGGSTLKVGADGTVMIDKIVTTYKTNGAGDPDDSWRDIQSAYTAAYVARELQFVINRDYLTKRAILVDDGTAIAAGIPHVTPRQARTRLISHYAYLETLGIVERADLFEQFLIVSREAKRLNVKYAPDLANPLDIVAIKIEFSIQWPDDLVNA